MSLIRKNIFCWIVYIYIKGKICVKASVFSVPDYILLKNVKVYKNSIFQ